MNVLLSHPGGNANVRAVLDGLLRANALSQFVTTVAISAEAGSSRLLPAPLARQLGRRHYDLPADLIECRSSRELARILVQGSGWRWPVRHEYGALSVDAVGRDLDRHVARQLIKGRTPPGLQAVYAYEDSARDTFVAARSRGLRTVYDLPIAYWETTRALMQQEVERFPAWASALGGGLADSEAKHQRKEDELDGADLVVAPSAFVSRSLPPWASDKRVVVVPFGSPPPAPFDPAPTEPGGPLRVLFAGSMGQRKGLADLFAAMQLLSDRGIELVVMGSPLTARSFYRSQFADFTWEPGRPHGEVLELMRTCHVFCLPSIVEGRALVMQEAMSQGLPIVVTPNTGGEDLVVEGVTGFIVPIRSPRAIADRLNWFVEHRDAIPDMAEAARRHAASYSWSTYGDRVADAVGGPDAGLSGEGAGRADA